MRQLRRKQEDRRQEAENALLDAAIELVSEKGYDRFTLAEVGERAGYSRGLPVHYFSTKDNLLSTAAERIVEGFTLRLQQRTRGEDSFLAIANSLREIALRTAEGGLRSRALQVILGAAIFNGGLSETVTRLNDHSIGWFAESLRHGIAAGIMRRDIDVYSEAVSLVAFHRGCSALMLVSPTFPMVKVTENFIDELRRRLLIAPAGA